MPKRYQQSVLASAAYPRICPASMNTASQVVIKYPAFVRIVILIDPRLKACSALDSRQPLEQHDSRLLRSQPLEPTVKPTRSVVKRLRMLTFERCRKNTRLLAPV